jgi:hypothetical protein
VVERAKHLIACPKRLPIAIYVAHVGAQRYTPCQMLGLEPDIVLRGGDAGTSKGA